MEQAKKYLCKVFDEFRELTTEEISAMRGNSIEVEIIKEQDAYKEALLQIKAIRETGIDNETDAFEQVSEIDEILGNLPWIK